VEYRRNNGACVVVFLCLKTVLKIVAIHEPFKTSQAGLRLTHKESAMGKHASSFTSDSGSSQKATSFLHPT